MVITHYILIFALRIMLKKNKKSNESSINSCIKEALMMNEDYQESLKNRNSTQKRTSNSVISRIINYHYSFSMSVTSEIPAFTEPSLALQTTNSNDVKNTSFIDIEKI